MRLISNPDYPNSEDGDIQDVTPASKKNSLKNKASYCCCNE